MKYRVYYNRSQDFPQLWSVDEGDQSTEFNVIDIDAVGCPVAWRALPPPIRAAEGVGPVFPSAWNEIEAAGVKVVRGVAVFTPPVSVK